MSDEQEPTELDSEAWTEVPDLGHPRGTLTIVVVYAVLFTAGWLALYLGVFLPRGLPQ